jgi:hypothetical protein
MATIYYNSVFDVAHMHGIECCSAKFIREDSARPLDGPGGHLDLIKPPLPKPIGRPPLYVDPVVLSTSQSEGRAVHSKA